MDHHEWIPLLDVLGLFPEAGNTDTQFQGAEKYSGAVGASAEPTCSTCAEGGKYSKVGDTSCST
jgi:hypothetical protein